MRLGYQKLDYDRPALGRLVEAVCDARGWTQSELARMAGVNGGSFSQVKAGVRGLTAPQLRRLLETLTDPTADVTFGRRELVARVPGLDEVWVSLERPTPHTSSVTARRTGGPTVARGENVLPPESHERLVQVSTARADWAKAAHHSRLAAASARSRGDLAGWTRYLLSAGHNEMNLGRLGPAETRFRTIVEEGKSSPQVGGRAVAEALIRLGWLYQRHEAYARAETHLRNGLDRARDLAPAEDTEGLIEDAQHLLGRIYLDWGVAQDEPDLIERGAAELDRAYEIARARGATASMGYSLLRQTLFRVRRDGADAADRHLDESASLIEHLPAASGHLDLYRSRVGWLGRERPDLALDRLGRAADSFAGPLFYAHGLATVFRERGRIQLTLARGVADHKVALEYTLASAALHPYGESLTALVRAAGRTSARMGSHPREFAGYREEVLDRLVRMEEGPFTVLRRLDEAASGHLIDQLPVLRGAFGRW